MVKKNQEEFLNVSIKKKEDFVPKLDLKYNEYTAIKEFYNSSDFERNSFISMVFPFVSTALWMI